MAIQAYEVEAFVGNWCAWEYDIDGIIENYVDGMSEKEFTDLCEYFNLHKRAIIDINNSYEKEDYDRYENKLERWARVLKISENKLEDDCTDAREFGYDRC